MSELANAAGWRTSSTTWASNRDASHSAEKTAIGSFRSGRACTCRARRKSR